MRKQDQALIEKRRAGQEKWRASLTPEQVEELKQKQQAGVRRWLEGRSELRRRPVT